MSHPLLLNCFQTLSRATEDEERRRVLQGCARELLRDPEVGAELVASIAAAPDKADVDSELEVFETLLWEARMDRENAGAHGTASLSMLEAAIERVAGTGRITEAGTFLLGRCYVRAGLEAPRGLRRSARAVQARPSASVEHPDLDALLERLVQEANGDAYGLHAALSELLATVDPDPRDMLIAEIMHRPKAIFDRLGCYWLLDGAHEIRQVAADVFLRHARSGGLDAATVARLVEIRGWLPADAARARLDQVLKEALRREAAGGAAPKPWTLHRLLATLPDGAGAQSFAIAAQRGGQRGVAMLLLKQGFGVKDAYVIPCGSATEQRRLMAQIAEEAGAHEVMSELLAPALAAALAEGQAPGLPPAHGLIDVVEILGLNGLRPEALAVEDWIARLDPEGELTRLSPQKLGRLVNASADWPERHRLIESWFEDSAAVEEILIEATTPRSREARLWRHLETRRDWWARLMAKAAATLKASAGGPDADWKSFAATALALANGRPLRNVPIMDWIAAGSFEASEDPWNALAGDPDDAGFSPEEALTSVAFTSPAPERAGELARLMRKVGIERAPEWLDGYLAAIVVAPKLVQPSAWLSGLLDQAHNFADHNELQRFLDLLLLRYNAANAELGERAATAAKIRSYDAQELGHWADGFTACVAGHKGHWTGRGVNEDDRRILRLIADGAKGRAGPSEFAALLPAWLTRRHSARR